MRDNFCYLEESPAFYGVAGFIPEREIFNYISSFKLRLLFSDK
jgi:hypothetical protein